MRSRAVSRREALRIGAAVVAAALAGCRDAFDPFAPREGSPRLTARPRVPTGSAPRGPSLLEVDPTRRCRLYVPSAYDPAQPIPLVLMFHGAGGRSADAMEAFRPFADDRSLILLAIDSAARSWDAIDGAFGPDVDLANRALSAAFDVCAVDAARVCVQGFSDGATYALALGRANGDLFSRVAAMSAGYLIPVERIGAASMYITHGVFDTIFPIDRTGKAIADALREEHPVLYTEFEGGHELPAPVVSAAANWLAAPG